MFFLSASFSTVAQTDTVNIPWCESFDDGNANGWLLIDNDGDNLNWTVDTYDPYDGGYSLFGYAYTNSTQDNWAISPAISLPLSGDDLTLTWKVMTHDNYSETYEVRLCYGNGCSPETSALLFTETIAGGYYDRQLDLTAYAGQTVHLVFRHTSNHQNYLSIDAICITPSDHQLQPPVVEIEAPDTALVGAEVTITALSFNADSYLWHVEGVDNLPNPTEQRIVVSWHSAGSYLIKVTATNDDGITTSTRTITIVDKACVASAQQNDVVIYPNPANKSVSIEADDVLQVAIIDMRGKITTVLDAPISRAIDVSHLPSGIYMLRVVTIKGATTLRLVKE